MDFHARVWLVGPAVSATLVLSMPTGVTASEPAVEPGVSVHEEPYNGGIRFRVSTSEFTIASHAKRSYRFRAECVHPTTQRETPDQCNVYLTSVSRKQVYKNIWHVPFAVTVDDAKAADGTFLWAKAVHEHQGVFEPLLTIWSWREMRAIAAGKTVVLTLADEAIPIPSEAVAGMNALVHYFDK